MYNYIKNLIHIEDINIRYAIRFGFGLFLSILLVTINFTTLSDNTVLKSIGSFIKSHWSKLIGYPLLTVCLIGLGWHIYKLLKEESKSIDKLKQENDKLKAQIVNLTGKLAIVQGGTTTIADLLNEAKARQKVWFRNYTNWQIIFWFIGVIGAISAAMAAREFKIGDIDYSRYFAVLSAIALALIGYLNPQREAYRHIHAWRILNAAIFDYQWVAGKDKPETILDALRQGETVLGAGEILNPQTPAPTKP